MTKCITRKSAQMRLTVKERILYLSKLPYYILNKHWIVFYFLLTNYSLNYKKIQMKFWMHNLDENDCKWHMSEFFVSRKRHALDDKKTNEINFKKPNFALLVLIFITVFLLWSYYIFPVRKERNFINEFWKYCDLIFSVCEIQTLHLRINILMDNYCTNQFFGKINSNFDKIVLLDH